VLRPPVLSLDVVQPVLRHQADLDTIPAGNELEQLYGAADYGWLDHRNGLARQPPYVYRVVTPLLARAISPMTGIDDAYWLISLLALAGAARFLGLTALRITDSAAPSVVVVAAFLTDPRRLAGT
jgi:hypothetical protein